MQALSWRSSVFLHRGVYRLDSFAASSHPKELAEAGLVPWPKLPLKKKQSASTFIGVRKVTRTMFCRPWGLRAQQVNNMSDKLGVSGQVYNLAAIWRGLCCSHKTSQQSIVYHVSVVWLGASIQGRRSLTRGRLGNPSFWNTGIYCKTSWAPTSLFAF